MTKCSLAGAAMICAALGLGSAAAIADDQQAQDQQPAAAPPATPAPAAPTLGPSMTGPLAANANPISFDLSDTPLFGELFGKTYVDGVVSGLAQWQDHVVPGFSGNKTSVGDLSNAQVFIQKIDGVFQYYIQAGAYSVPDLGVPYLKAGTAINTFYGPLPEAYVKLAPTDTLSVQVGKLPTLIGAEYTFSFENMNVERGLVWNLEPQISNGAQINYTKGPLALSVSINDGFYSHKWNWVTGAATWTINSANTLEFVGGGSFSTDQRSTYETIVPLNNSSIYNLIYTYNSGPWTVTPYVQYTHVDALPFAGTTSASSYAGALLLKYAFTSAISVTARGEYVGTTGNRVTAANFLYGPGSNAWSLTLTPTYQFKIFFLRAEVSYVKATDTTPGLVFGPLGTQTSQTRLIAETGILF